MWRWGLKELRDVIYTIYTCLYGTNVAVLMDVVVSLDGDLGLEVPKSAIL